MADIKSQEKRSINMSHIHGSDTHPEVVFRKWLFSEGYRYSLGNNTIPGHPDLWISKYNTALFVHGCFWHRHEGCKYSYMPKSRVEFWNNKFEKNVVRDKRVAEELEKKGIRHLIIWECTVKKMEHNMEYRDEIMNQVIQFLNSAEKHREL